MHMRFSEDGYGPKNQKFWVLQKESCKVSELLLEWLYMARVLFDCLLFDWKTQIILSQSHPMNKRNLKKRGFFLNTVQLMLTFQFYLCSIK